MSYVLIARIVFLIEVKSSCITRSSWFYCWSLACIQNVAGILRWWLKVPYRYKRNFKSQIPSLNLSSLLINAGIKNDSADKLLHKPTTIPALVLKHFTDAKHPAWKSDVYCSHFTDSKTDVEWLVSLHASRASVPVGSRAGLSLTVKVNRGETNILCLLFYCYVRFTCCWKCCTKWKVYVVVLPNWVAHRLYI